MSSVNEVRSVFPRPTTIFTVSIRLLGVFVALGDVAGMMVAKLLASTFFGAPEYAATESLRDGLIAVIVVLSLGRWLGLYRLQNVLRPERVIRSILLSTLMAILVVVFMLFLGKVSAVYSRGGILSFALFSSLLLLLSRFGLAALFSVGVARDVIRGRQVVLIGEFSELERLRKSEMLHFGFEEIARFGLATGGSESLSKGDRARIKQAIDIARDARATEFALLLPWSRDRIISEITSVLRASPLAVRLYPDRKTRDILNQKRDSGFNPYLSVVIQREPLNRYEQMLKRALDICLSVFGLLALSPLFLFVATMIKLDSPGPVFFRQRRCGFDNREFLIWKFRSMTVLENGPEIAQARKNDRRVTAVGRILRRTSVDELPQLLNVLRGDMSLVGPRPHAIAHDELYGNAIAEYSLRHHVKPGLTGVAQVLGYRGETRTVADMEKRVQHDIWYANNWSLWLDIRLIAQTFAALARNEAY